jgi:hypothetical protein
MLKYRRMRKLLFFLAITLAGSNLSLRAQSAAALVDICRSSAGNDATYLKDFTVELEAAKANEKTPQMKFSMVLSKNTRYRFSICSSESSQGHGMIQLYDENKLMACTYNASTGKEYHMFDFNCTKTGVYHVFISFIDGKPGSAVGILSFVEKL